MFEALVAVCIAYSFDSDRVNPCKLYTEERPFRTTYRAAIYPGAGRQPLAAGNWLACQALGTSAGMAEGRTTT